jgi:hypothetical protein
MPTIPLNSYDFTMRLPDGRQERHREINTTQARATRKAAGWMVGIWNDYPEAVLTCAITIGVDSILRPDLPPEIPVGAMDDFEMVIK